MFRKFFKEARLARNYFELYICSWESPSIFLCYCCLSETPGSFLGTGSFIVKSKLITTIAGWSLKALVQGCSYIKQWGNLSLALVWHDCKLAACTAAHIPLDLCVVKEKHRVGRICPCAPFIYPCSSSFWVCAGGVRMFTTILCGHRAGGMGSAQWDASLR